MRDEIRGREGHVFGEASERLKSGEPASAGDWLSDRSPGWARWEEVRARECIVAVGSLRRRQIRFNGGAWTSLAWIAAGPRALIWRMNFLDIKDEGVIIQERCVLPISYRTVFVDIGTPRARCKTISLYAHKYTHTHSILTKKLFVWIFSSGSCLSKIRSFFFILCCWFLWITWRV